MNYLLKSKPKHENRKKIIAVLVGFLFLSLLGFLFPNFLRKTSTTIARPLWVIGSTIVKPFSKITGYFSWKSSLIDKNQALEDENASLKVKELDYDLLSAENETLKTELGRTSTQKRIVSGILSKPPRSPYDTLVIDVGLKDGISLGSKVYANDNIIIGSISSITTNTSLASLFSTGGQKQDAILSRTGATFTLIGKGGANFQLEVPKDSDILWGDIFMYPGIDNAVLASVYYIDTNSQSSFKTVYLRIPVNVFASKDVFIENM